LSQKSDNHTPSDGPGTVRERFDLGIEHRQVFFLFAGLAVGAGLVFSLGVMVGKRWRATVERAQVVTREDPLARLDVSAEDLVPGTELSFPRELGRAAPHGPAVLPPAPPVAAAPASVHAAAHPAAHGNAHAAPARGAAKPAAIKPQPVALAEAKPVRPSRSRADRLERAERPQRSEPMDRTEPSAGPATAAGIAGLGLTRPVAAIGLGAGSGPGAGFRRKADADALAARLSARGQKVRVTRVQRPGSVAVYRVRSASVASRSEAGNRRP
jgi:hypothetical protein